MILLSSKLFRCATNLHGLRRMSSVSTIELTRELGRILPEQRVSTNASDLDVHGNDEGSHKPAPPQVVVFPQNKEEISEILKYCNSKKVPVIPYGAASGVEGGITAPNGGVCVDMQAFDRIIRVSPEDFDCTVEAAVTWRNLNTFLRDQGLWFPVDPGANATLGGMCSTSASGTNAVRYGTMRENVLNLEVVLADGRIIHTAGIKGRARKTSAGYNLTNLFVGSEGTLGIITSATLRLHAIPEKQVSAVVQFETAKSAIQSVVEVFQNAVPLARVEFLDDKTIEVCNAYAKTDLSVKPTLMIEFHGTEASIKEQIAIVESVCKSNGSTELKWAEGQEERNKLWKARHSVFYATCSQVPNSRCYTTDVCVPISNLPDLLASAKADIEREGIFGTVVGHVGDGNFHTLLLFDPNDPSSKAKVRNVAERLATRAIELDGTCTGEHGVGIGKKELVVKEHGAECVSLMKSIKLAIDPNNIFNPTKIFD